MSCVQNARSFLASLFALQLLSIQNFARRVGSQPWTAIAILIVALL